ncbi:MAG: IreB family regulatory phosphoprotein [Firmicutes bacterium]|nr:IreB family regulatory phosphoprotein [Bacillota bacterium]
MADKFDNGNTITFEINQDNEERTKTILNTVYNSLVEKGYNPLNQLVGYILSEDPTYITNYNNARALIRKLDREALLKTLIKSFLDI